MTAAAGAGKGKESTGVSGELTRQEHALVRQFQKRINFQLIFILFTQKNYCKFIILIL
jgi:hypothetical protein